MALFSLREIRPPVIRDFEGLPWRLRADVLVGLQMIACFGYTVGGKASAVHRKDRPMNRITFPMLLLGLSLAPVLCMGGRTEC